MPKALLIHSDKATLAELKSMFANRFQTETALDVVKGAKLLAKHRPDLIVVENDRRREDAVALLTCMRDNQIKLPVVVLLGPGASGPQPKLMKFGVRAFVEHPLDRDRMAKAVKTASAAHKELIAPPPPVTREEVGTNLSVLETKLNKDMKCFAGKNKVFIQSQLLGRGTSKPRICLKCLLRAEYGLAPNVYYEFIRDICCGDPNKCPAYWAFQQERESA